MTLSDFDKRSQGNAPRKVRSPKVFYEQMMTFKEKKEERLQELRDQKLKDEDLNLKSRR